MKIKIFLIFYLFLIRLIYSVEIVDNVGRKINIDLPVKKIISLSPSETETIFFLNAEKLLYGISKNCDYPEKVKKIPIVGDFLNPDIEKIIKISPDIVFSGGGVQKRVISKLEKLNIPVFVFYPQNINQILDNIRIIGKLTGREKLAEKKIKNILKKLKRIRDDKLKKRIKVYIELWGNPALSIGKNSFINSFISIAGGKNIFDDLISEYPKVSKEEIIKRNPDIIILLYTPDKNYKTKNHIKLTNAGKNNNIYILSKKYQDILLRPSPRFINGINYLHNLFKECLKNEN